MGTILIVDDDPDILESLEMVLEDSWVVHRARHGEEALAVLEATPVDVILLDLMMPIMNGAGLMGELTRRSSSVPVIIASASTNGRELALSLGATDYLSKPFTIEDLEQKLLAAVAQRLDEAS